MNYKIRIANYNEALSVIKLKKELVEYQKDYENIHSLLNMTVEEYLEFTRENINDQNKDYIILIDTDKNEISGIMLVEIIENKFYFHRKTAFISFFYIQESFRWKWYGRKMMDYCEEYLKTKWVWCITLWVAPENNRAMDVYKELWFIPYLINMKKEILERKEMNVFEKVKDFLWF